MAELQQKYKSLVEELLQHLSHLHKSSALYPLCSNFTRRAASLPVVLLP